MFLLILYILRLCIHYMQTTVVLEMPPF